MVNAYVNCCYRMTSYRQPTVYLFVSERSSVYLTGEARRRPPLFAYVWCQPSVRVEGLKLARDAGASRIPHCCLALRLDLDLHRAEISPQLEQTGGKEPGTSCNKRPRTNSTATNPDSDVSPRTRGSGSSGSASPGMDPLAELSEYERIRVEYQQSVQAQRAAAHMKKKGKLEVSAVLPPEVDAVVNAATRQFKCYRKPIAAFYENDRIGENII